MTRFRGWSLRTQLLSVVGVVVALGAGNAAIFAWGAGRQDAAFAEVEQALERERTLIEQLGRLRDLHRQVQLLADVVQLDDAWPRAEELAAFAEERVAVVERMRAVVAQGEADSTLREAVVGVEDLFAAWARFYELQRTQPGEAVAVLALEADPLAADLLGTALPASIRHEQRRARTAGIRFQDAGRVVTRLTLVAFLLSTGVAGALVLLIVRDLARGVRALRDGAERLGRSEYSEYEEPLALDRHDELAEVAASFNRMAARVHHAHEALAHRNVELEGALSRLRDAQERLVQQAKMGAVGTMLAGLAHEINNPLAGIVTLGDMLTSELQEHGLGDAAHELVEPIVREALRAGELVTTLLQFARRAQPVLVPVNVAESVGVAVRLRAYAFQQAGWRLDTKVPADLWVRAEAQRLQQAFLNIINNAYDALRQHSGTGLTIRATCENGAWVQVTFDDDGPGLPDPGRVFEPFYTTKGVGEGTGLGLALVHQFAEEFGGRVRATNRPGGGASFIMHLVAVPAAGVAPTDKGVEEQPVAGRVLLVDDEETVRNALERVLRRIGCDVTAVRTADEGLAVLERGEFDLVVSDLRTPGAINGLDLLRWVEVHRPALAARYVLVTGAVEHDEAALPAAELGDRLLHKPFKAEALVRRVRAMLEDARLHARPPG